MSENVFIRNFCAPMLFVTFLAWGNQVVAQTPEAVQQWFDDEWARAALSPAPEKLAISYSISKPGGMSAAAIAELGKRIAGYPDHPERAVLVREERRLAKGPDIVHHKVWYIKEVGWRHCQTFEYGDSGFLDIAATEQFAWALIPTNLAVVDSASPPPGREYAQHEFEVFKDLSLMLGGGLWVARRGHVQPMNVQLSGSRWSVELRGANDLRERVEGRWDLDAGRGFVEVWVILEEPGVATAGEKRWEFKDYKQDAVLNGWVAQTVVDIGRDGKVIQTLNYTAASRTDKTAVEALVAIPKFDGEDPVRGKAKFTRVEDLRSSAELVTIKTPTQIIEMAAPEREHTSAQALRWVGWAVCAALVGAIVGIRLRRSRASQRVSDSVT